MDHSKECNGCEVFHGSFWLLLKVHWGVFQDHTPNYLFCRRRESKFLWSQKCVESFQLLKKILTNAPILKSANPKMNCVVCIDACIKGLGGVLMQDNHVVCMFGSYPNPTTLSMYKTIWSIRSLNGSDLL